MLSAQILINICIFVYVTPTTAKEEFIIVYVITVCFIFDETRLQCNMDVWKISGGFKNKK